MIDKNVFKRAWALLVAHYGKKFPDPETEGIQLTAYWEYLSQFMDTAEFQEAVRAVWAVREFFPRPADFLMVRAAADWRFVQKAIDRCEPPEWGWKEHFDQVSPRGRDACIRLGGIPTMKPGYDRDPMRMKAAFERAYEESATAETLALPAPQERKAVAAGARALKAVP